MMLLAEHSSEFDRMCACGRSVCTTTLGLRGSETSTPVKFFGALSCASQMMRRPSLAIVMDMPSPMPPKPPRSFWASSLKFQVMGSPVWVNGLLAAGINVSGACRCRGKAGADAPAPRLVDNGLGHCLLEEFGAQRLAPIRNRLDFLFLEQDFRLHLHVGLDVCRPAGSDLDAGKRLGECFRRQFVA